MRRWLDPYGWLLVLLLGLIWLLSGRQDRELGWRAWPLAAALFALAWWLCPEACR